MSKKKDSKNLRLAGLFLVLVLGLIVLSVFFKCLLIVKASRFDGSHNFIVAFVGQNKTKVASFSPKNKSLSLLDVDVENVNDLVKLFSIPVDATIVSEDLSMDDMPLILLKSAFSLGQQDKNLNTLDAFRLFFFSKTVSQTNIHQKKLLTRFSDVEKSTIISLALSDPAIYQESQSIQVINGAGIYGAGTRLAKLISNIGGNVILISTSDKAVKDSKITYYGNKTYTVKKLGDYLGFPVEETDKRGVADITIIIGKDKADSFNF